MSFERSIWSWDFQFSQQLIACAWMQQRKKHPVIDLSSHFLWLGSSCWITAKMTRIVSKSLLQECGDIGFGDDWQIISRYLCQTLEQFSVIYVYISLHRDGNNYVNYWRMKRQRQLPSHYREIWLTLKCEEYLW